MATNKEILSAFKRKKKLKDTKLELQRTIQAAQRKLDKVSAELELARAVDDVFDGIPVSKVSDGPTHFDMRTLESGVDVEQRNVHGYQIATGTTWVVRLNGDYGLRPLFFGGEVVGLDKRWSRDEATAVARRWLTGDDSVLKA